MKNKKKENENLNTEKPKMNKVALNSTGLMIKEVFLAVFVALSVVLGLTLYFYYKVNSSYEEEISFMKDVHHLRTTIKPFSLNKVKGFIEISEVFEGVNIIGKIEGLAPGSTHSIHVLEYSDISELEANKVTKDFLKHYNPTNARHSCPSNEKEENYHFGDFGNIIANNEGVGFISITRKVSIKSLNGRIVVVNNSADKCEESLEYDEVKDILGFGLLSTVKPNLPPPINHSTDYLMKEVNAANKKEFERKNNIDSKEKKSFIKKENTDMKNLNNVKAVKEEPIIKPEPIIKSEPVINNFINSFSNTDSNKLSPAVNVPKVNSITKIIDNNPQNLPVKKDEEKFLFDPFKIVNEKNEKPIEKRVDSVKEKKADPIFFNDGLFQNFNSDPINNNFNKKHNSKHAKHHQKENKSTIFNPYILYEKKENPYKNLNLNNPVGIFSPPQTESSLPPKEEKTDAILEKQMEDLLDNIIEGEKKDQGLVNKDNNINKSIFEMENSNNKNSHSNNPFILLEKDKNLFPKPISLSQIESKNKRNEDKFLNRNKNLFNV